MIQADSDNGINHLSRKAAIRERDCSGLFAPEVTEPPLSPTAESLPAGGKSFPRKCMDISRGRDSKFYVSPAWRLETCLRYN